MHCQLTSWSHRDHYLKCRAYAWLVIAWSQPQSWARSRSNASPGLARLWLESHYRSTTNSNLGISSIWRICNYLRSSTTTRGCAFTGKILPRGHPKRNCGGRSRSIGTRCCSKRGWRTSTKLGRSTSASRSASLVRSGIHSTKPRQVDVGNSKNTIKGQTLNIEIRERDEFLER